MEMTTTAAAETAGVTTATIRTWCRVGAVAARKVSGRWSIDTISLKARIRIARGLRKAAIQRKAEAGRNRILATLNLPDLTGTDKQIAWATDLRHDRIARALTAHVTVRGVITYRLRAPYDDALGVNYLDLPDTFTTEAEALEALHIAATTGRRTTAAWWIDNRDNHAPMG